MEWFWIFFCYSFAGFLLEVAFAMITGGRRDRKCLLLLPLCPVYGLGACAILWLTPLAAGNRGLMFLLGAGAATVVEYALAVWYEEGLGVQFWDYSGLPGNFRGRVCLPFSLAWGVLSLGLVYWLHPLAESWLERIPGPVTLSAMVLTAADLVLSGVMLRQTGERACLQWYKTAAE